MKTFLYPVIVYLLILQGEIQASPDPHWIPPDKGQLISILDHIYNLEFEQAEKKIADYRSTYPWRPEGPFAEGMVLWMQVLADLYNPGLDEQFVKKMDEIIREYDRLAKDDSLYVVTRFYKSAAIGFKARLYVNREKWIKAAITGLKAVSGIIDALEGEYPNTDAKLGTGLYLYYADLVPDKYPFAVPLLIFYPSGDREKGLSDLRETSEKGLFARTEATYIYAQTLYLYEKKYYQAFRIMQNLVEKYPQNPVFLRWHIAMAYSVASFSKALAGLDVYEDRIKNGSPFYMKHQLRLVYYRRGLISQRRKAWQQAIDYYDLALRPLPAKIEEEMRRYRVMCLLNKGYCLNRLDLKKESLSVYREVLEESDIDGSHERAKKEINRIMKNEN